MSVIENLDIVLGAKTQQLDRALLNEVKNVDKFRGKINGGDAPVLRLFKSGASDVAKAIPGVGQVTSSVSSLASSLSGAAAAAGPVGIAIAAGAAVALGGVVALGFAWHNVSEEMKRIDEISDSAQKLGMTFRDLSNVRLSLSETSGLDQGAIDNAMQRMQVGLADASSKQSGDLFDKLAASGLDAGELLKMGPAKALEEISAKTRDLKNPTDQLVLAYELFGKQGAALVTSLREGPDAMRSMADFADKVGMNLTQAQAEGVGAANDAWGRLEMVATGAWRQISAEAAPVLEVIYNAIADGTSEFSVYLDYLPAIVDSTAATNGVKVVSGSNAESRP